MSDYQGRGAWSSKGVGGTLKDNNNPGPYYMYTNRTLAQIGAVAYFNRDAGRPTELNFLATYHGVVGIQTLLNSQHFPCPVTGVFTSETDAAVKVAQRTLGLVADGKVGQTTMKTLLKPLVVSTAKKSMNIDPQPIWGILANEGAFDPGAVGFYDSNDLGLAQINILAHPEVTISQAFCPSYSVQFVADKIAAGISEFHDVELAIAAYNLGIGGTKQWIAAGRPDIWTPPWADKPRNVRKYIDNILGVKL